MTFDTVRRTMKKYPSSTKWLAVITVLEIVLIIQNFMEH